MNNKQLIAVVLGGASAERKISIKTGTEVLKAINKNKYDVILLDGATEKQLSAIDCNDGSCRISYETYLNDGKNRRPDLMFLALHGTYGEDGTIQSHLDQFGLKYTFSNAKSSANAMDKVIAKELFDKAGLLTAKQLILKKNNDVDINKISKTLGSSVVVKPVKQGSSFGISIAHNQKQLESAIDEAFKFDSSVMIEKYIKGTEITVATMGNNKIEAMPVIEIKPTKSEFFDYYAKYNESGCKEICPAGISDSLSRKAQKQAILAHKALKCRGIARTDMIIEEGTNNLYILETNTIPGMTPISLLPKAAKAAGLTFTQLIQKIIDLGME